MAAGLGESVEVQLVEVTDAPTEADSEVALIVAGGPTHAFSMSRENTRADAISKGAPEGEQEFGLREWLSALPSGQHTEKMATFRHEGQKDAPPARISRQKRREGRQPPWL